MSEIIERIRAAIEDEHALATGTRISSRNARRYARRAIEEMRKPTDEMITALNGYAVCAGYIEEGWAAAIDVALKE